MPRASPRQSSAPCLPRSQPGIQNFARATKPGGHATSLSGKLTASPSKKRKLCELANVESGTGRPGSRGKERDGNDEKEGLATLTPSKTLQIGELTLSTPRSGHYVSPSLEGSSPSPLKRSRTLLQRPPRQQKQQQQQQQKQRSRPPIFYDVLNLHSSFLKALTLHSAHHGVSAPADLREFLCSIERIWKKRKVVVKDLQRLIWIWDQGAESNSTGHSYRLANYGLGRVCLERRIQGGEFVDENQLQEQFEQELELLWEKAVDGSPVEGEERGMDGHFVETLGLSPIHESLTPFTSFRKGQQRLQDLRGGVIRWKIEKLRRQSAEDETAPKPVEMASIRRKGLWDRIKGKQLRQSQLPPPPSKEMLLRRAAAERIEEVAGVLALLRPAGSVNKGRVALQRTPFRLETIIQNVQDSARNPISAEEVDICLGLLAQPGVAGQWVNIAMVKEVKSVILKSCCDVSIKEIGARIDQMRVGFENEVRFG